MYPQKVREVLNNWPHETALECSEAIAELLLNPEINAFVLAKVFSSNELFTVAKMISATLLRHKLEEVRVWALKNLWTLCNHEENSARGHLAETFVEVRTFRRGAARSCGSTSIDMAVKLPPWWFTARDPFYTGYFNVGGRL